MTKVDMTLHVPFNEASFMHPGDEPLPILGYGHYTSHNNCGVCKRRETAPEWWLIRKQVTLCKLPVDQEKYGRDQCERVVTLNLSLSSELLRQLSDTRGRLCAHALL